MESYRILNNNFIQRQSDLKIIPCILRDEDYVQYLSDVSNGATIIPFDVAYEITQAAEYEVLYGYKEKRRLEYPPMADYLDGIVKNDSVQIQKYIDDCLAVKVKYPKPE